MLHPDYPVVSGYCQMTPEWSVKLPEQFNRRVEDGDLVIWRPGFTIWTAVWGNDGNRPAAERMEWIKGDISEGASDLVEEEGAALLRLRYRLDEPSDDARVPAFYGFAVSDNGHVQMAMYFDAEADVELADAIWRSLRHGATA